MAEEFLQLPDGESLIYDFTNKENNIREQIKYMLSRTQAMFEYDGLPDTIPQKELELILQIRGYGIIAKIKNDDLYILKGSWGGELDGYYRPKTFLVANPYIDTYGTYKINEDCILMYNNDLWQGLLPIYSKYATLLTENELSIKIADINQRIMSLILADDEIQKASAETYLSNIESGKLGAIANDTLLDGIKTQPYATSGKENNISQLIELEQYLKASMYNDIGLQSNYNMKRESINANESQLDTDGLLPLVDNMLKCRKEQIDKVNKMFGTNITVKLSSSWEDRQEETELITDQFKRVNEETKEEPEETKEEPEETKEKDGDNDV